LKFKLVIFDFDGTLADSLGGSSAFPTDWPTSSGSTESTGAGCHSQAPRRRHAAETTPCALVEGALHRGSFPQLDGQTDRDDRSFPGVPDLLGRLAQAGSTLAIVTSNSCANVRRVLGRKNMGLIAACEGGVSVFGKRMKLRKVLRHIGIHPAQAIFIGDEIRDIEAARQAGIASGAVGLGLQPTWMP